ncbi:MAG TPA: SH3 domain-containing protein [Catenuloplanes sp.]|jgi:uncharacterized protein YraI
MLKRIITVVAMLLATFGVSAAIASPAQAANCTYEVTASAVNVRTQPYTYATIVAQFPRGHRFTATCESRLTQDEYRWVQVKSSTYRGVNVYNTWVAVVYLRRV